MTKEAKKTLLSLGLVILGLVILSLSKPLFASVRCETQYEGGEVCKEIKLQLDKYIWDPSQGKFVDNLYINDHRFGPGDEITFQIRVKNVGDETLEKININDYLPPYVKHISGDLSYEIWDLEVDEIDEKEIKVQVSPEQDIPNDQTVICEENETESWDGIEVHEAFAKFCIEKKVLGVKVVEELPPTGPQYGILLLGVSMLSGLAGLVFKKINWL